MIYGKERLTEMSERMNDEIKCEYFKGLSSGTKFEQSSVNGNIRKEFKVNSRKKTKLIADVYFLGLSIAVLSLFFLAMKSGAADYNFYFNNTEQGDNSTNTPSMSVNGKPVTVENEQKIEGAEGESESIQPEILPPAPMNQTGVTMPVVDRKPRPKYFRAMLGILAPIKAPEAAGQADGFFDQQYQPGDEDSASMMLSFGVMPLKYLGFNVFASGYSAGTDNGTIGAEVEVNPIHVGLFGFEDTLELGAMAGVWNLSRVRHEEDFIGTTRKKEKSATGFVGARVGLNFGKEAATKASWIVSTEFRASQDHQLANLGIGLKF
ncbi:hypothetical protein GW915_03915 [bacterium]|nr:hypothetical protein [bacterium]